MKPTQLDHEAVKEQAYLIAEQEGFPEGCHADHWHRAERMLIEQKKQLKRRKTRSSPKAKPSPKKRTAAKKKAPAAKGKATSKKPKSNSELA